MGVLRVLLVDDDAWTKYLVSSVLGKRGHQLRVAHTVEEALALSSDSFPDLIITEAVLLSGAEAGLALADSLVAQPKAAPAILILSMLPAQDERVRRVGGDGYLAKPFRFVDLDRAVEKAVQLHKRRAQAEFLPEPFSDVAMSSGIHGTLDQLGLSSLLTMIEMERKSGILLLRRGSQSARLYCKDGRVLAARLFGAAAVSNSLSGAEVVYWLLRWTDGYFNFTSMPVSVADEIGLRTTVLLLEGARRSDEAPTSLG